MNVTLNLRERFERMEPREQKLVGIMGAILVVMLVLLVPVVLAATTASRKHENEAIRDVMSAIAAARPDLEKADAQKARIVARYGRPAPPLAGFLEQAASAHGIEIPESQDRPPVPHSNKRYEERQTKIELQKVGMRNLSLFFEAIENSGYPVRVSGISLRKRPEQDSWDVTVQISAFDRKEGVKAPKAGDSAEAPAGKEAP
ncbi:MAG TPA: type II secretion system protein GspM [Polyangiaceae bacterium]|nr:type II secretion system protein GspM [Polyangiaceae bacterium]